MGRLTRRSRAASVLLVEDDTNIARLLTQVLEEAGFRVRAARDGVEALQLYEVESPELVVTDLTMPRMGGIELIRRLREAGWQKRVVVITARLEAAREVGGVPGAELLVKPFDLDTFEDAVARAVAAASA